MIELTPRIRAKIIELIDAIEYEKRWNIRDVELKEIIDRFWAEPAPAPKISAANIEKMTSLHGKVYEPSPLTTERYIDPELAVKQRPIVWTYEQWLEYQRSCRRAGYSGRISGVLVQWSPEMFGQRESGEWKSPPASYRERLDNGDCDE